MKLRLSGICLMSDSDAFILHPSSFRHALDDERAVLRAEAYAVAERDAHVLLTRAVGRVVEVALGRGLVEVYRRRHEAVLHSAERGTEPRRARSALRVAYLRLRARHRDAPRRVPERELERPSL